MPTWLVHGFRWPRPLIRIHIILQNLEDAAADWLMAPLTVSALTQNFHSIYPSEMAHLNSLRFIEQYNPEDLKTSEQPYAYVCDQVHEVELGVDIDEVRGKGISQTAWTALTELRDKIAPAENIGWFVVVNGDVERWVPPVEDPGVGSSRSTYTGGSLSLRSSVVRVEEETDSDQTEREHEPKGLRKWFGGRAMRKSKSVKDLRRVANGTKTPAPLSPPLPNVPRNNIVSATNTTAPRPASTNGKAPVTFSNGKEPVRA